MKRLWAGIIIVVGLLALTAPVGAGGAEPIVVTGTLGPGGTANISAEHCGGGSNPPGQWQVIFYRVISEGVYQVAGPGGSGTTDVDGNWSFALPIPADAVPGVEYMIHAGCTWFSGEPISFNYDDYFFVMGEAVTPTTDTTASTDTTSSIDAEEAEAAATSPRFTG